MGIWIDQIKRLIRAWFKSYAIFWGIIGVFIGCALDNLVVFVPLCICLGYYYEARYQEKMGVGNGRKK